MRTVLAAAAGLAAIACTAAAAQEYKAGTIVIEAPWIRATPAGAQVAGGYMKLTNTGKEADRLIDGSSAVAESFEIHEMSMEGSVAMMRQLSEGLELEPGRSVELKPGSYHIMLTGLRRQLKEGDKVKGTLAFEKAGKIEIEYAVEAMGSRGGGHGAHGGMKTKKMRH